MSAGDEAVRRQADRLEEERARPVPRPDRVVAVDRLDLLGLFEWLRRPAPARQTMSTDAFAAALRIARAAGIEFP